MGLIPAYNYCLAQKIEKDSATVTSTDIRDTHQYFEILAVGAGSYEYGVFIEPTAKVGDIVWIMEHGDADTPKELSNKGLSLFQCTRIMATENKNSFVGTAK